MAKSTFLIVVLTIDRKEVLWRRLDSPCLALFFACGEFAKITSFSPFSYSVVVYVLENEFPEDLYNLGSGEDITIKELAETIQKVTGHKGKIIWDSSKPDGTPRKLMDISKMKEMGWEYKTDLQQGIEKTYSWFLENIENIKEVKL